MNKTILVGIDFSECSLNALRHAAQLAQKIDGEIVMLWVNRVANDNDIIKHDQDLIEFGAKQRFNELVGEYEPVVGEGKVKCMIKQGRVYEVMMDVCSELKPLLVIVGSHGNSGFQERFIGSNAFRMALLLNVPTIIIREGIDIHHTIERIVMPIDSTVQTRQKMPLTASLAKYFDATVHVLAVYTVDYADSIAVVNGYVNQVVTFMKKHGVKCVTAEAHDSNEADAVINYSKSINANLVSIMDEQEKKAINLITGSFANQIVNNSPYPVLISHTEDLFF